LADASIFEANMLTLSYLLLPILGLTTYSQDAGWGSTVNGVRGGLALTQDRSGIELTFENTGQRDLYLLLGDMGQGYPNAVRFTIGAPGEEERNLTFRRTSQSPASSVPSPLVVPLLPGSRYTFRAPLSAFGLQTSRRARFIRAHLRIEPGAGMRYVRQYGLQIFWAGALVTNPISIGDQ